MRAGRAQETRPSPRPRPSARPWARGSAPPPSSGAAAHKAVAVASTLNWSGASRNPRIAPWTRDTARPVSRIPYSVISSVSLYPVSHIPLSRIPYPVIPPVSLYLVSHISHYPVSRIPLSQYPVPRIPYSASCIPYPVSHSPNPIIPYPTYPGEGGNDLISSNARTTTVFYQGILSRSLSFLILCKILWL